MKKIEEPNVEVILLEEVDMIATSDNDKTEHGTFRGITLEGTAFGEGESTDW